MLPKLMPKKIKSYDPAELHFKDIVKPHSISIQVKDKNSEIIDSVNSTILLQDFNIVYEKLYYFYYGKT